MADRHIDIQLIDVHKAFGERVVLDGVSMSIAEGQTTAIIGPSGAGKSVLLKLIVGLIDADSGQVLVDGVDMGRASEREKYRVRRKFGMLFQHNALFDSFTAGENVAFPLVYHSRLNERQRRERAEEVLALVGLERRHDSLISELSGGQQKRVALARAIVMEPAVVFFDEPNSGLDPLTSDTIDQLILDMKRQLGITFVVITHDIVSAAHIADHIAMLWEAKLIADAPKAEFVRSEHEIVRRFLQRNLQISG